MGTKPPAGRSFRHGIAVTPPSKREAVESVRPRGQGLEVTSSRIIEKYYFSRFARRGLCASNAAKPEIPSSRKIGKYYGLGEANVVLFFGRRRLSVPGVGKTQSSIFTKIRKVLLSFLREPTRSPFLLKHRLTQTKSPHPTAVSPTHRKVRSAIPPKPHPEATKLMQPRPSVAERMRKRSDTARRPPKKLSLPGFLSARESRPSDAHTQNPGCGPGGAKNKRYAPNRLCRP